MSPVTDFRTSSFATGRIVACGRFVGRSSYWQLYAIENIFRVLIHSVLSVQIDPMWMAIVVTGDWNKQLQKRKHDYLTQPGGGTLPGRHDIYYLFLKDLTKILTAHSQLFIQSVPNIDQWIVDLEKILMPRNIVGHMN